MIRHMSMPVGDPSAVAPVLAELAGGTPVRAPSPPFPDGAWFVCLGDAGGGMIELLPADTVLDPDAPLGLRRGATPAGPGPAHVLVTTPLDHAQVRAVAAREGWRTQEIETGLFEVVKVWVDDAHLFEFIAADKAPRYAAAFGGEGAATLDGKLRALETGLAQALAAAGQARAAGG